MVELADSIVSIRGVHTHETEAKLSQNWKPQLSEIWKVLAKLCESWQFCLVLRCRWNSQTPSELTDLQIHNSDLSFLKSAHGSLALMAKNCTVLGWFFTLLSSLLLSPWLAMMSNIPTLPTTCPYLLRGWLLHLPRRRHSLKCLYHHAQSYAFTGLTHSLLFSMRTLRLA